MRSRKIVGLYTEAEKEDYIWLAEIEKDDHSRVCRGRGSRSIFRFAETRREDHSVAIKGRVCRRGILGFSEVLQRQKTKKLSKDSRRSRRAFCSYFQDFL